MVRVRTLDSAAPGFDAEFEALVARLEEADEEVEGRVREIIARVRREGDAALLDLTRRLDGLEMTTSRFDAESEILIQLAHRGAKIGSAPIRTIYGDEESKIRPVRDTIRFIKLVRRYRRRGKGA